MKREQRTEQRTERVVAALEALEHGLREHLGSLRALARDLELAPAPRLGLRGGEVDLGPRRADLVALDRGGRLLLVLLVEGTHEECVHAAIDALCFARASGAELARHAGAPAPHTDQTPRVALVSESFSPQVLAALATLRAPELLAFEVRTLRSASGASAHLVPQLLSGQEPLRCEPQHFLERLEGAQRELAQRVLERAARLDEQIELQAGPELLAWSFQGEELGALVSRGQALWGECAARGERRELRTAEDVERWLETLLRRHVDLLGQPLRSPAPPLAPPPLLSAEELAAFRG